MATYRVTGTTKENNVAVQCLVVAYKASRDSYFTIGQELGRVTSDALGNFEITFSDWADNVFVVCLDPTDTPTLYNGVIIDWVTGEYIGNDPEYDKVQLLMHMEGPNGGISFEDETGKVFSHLGSANTSTIQAKFGGSSLQLTGADVIETPSDPAFNIGAFDFCAEAWVYQTSSTGTQVIFDMRGLSGYGTFLLRIDSGVLKLWTSSTGTAWNVSALAGPAVPVDTWSHVAAVKYDGVFSVYVNGVRGSTNTNASALMAAQNSFKIGNNQSLSEGFIGFIDEVRLTIGNGRYSGNFFPPTLTFPTGGDAYFPQVKSLLHFNGLDGGTTFTDEVGPLPSTTGLPTTSTTQFKFGTSSLLLDGNSTVSINYRPDLNVQYADFTFECWSFTTAPKSTTYRHLVDKRIANTGYAAFILRIYDGTYQAYVRNGTSSWVSVQTGSNTVLINQWQHLALTRSLGKVRLFINGTKVWEGSHSVPIIADTNPFEMGKSYIGHIDDVRFTVGVARYEDDFPLPSKEFDNQ